MTSSRRIILNTTATFVRSVLAAGLALFSSRWILNALGQTDFGLFALVGTLIAFVAILNGVLGGSVGRYLAFAIGKGDMLEVNQWFNTAIVIHTILPGILILIGWPIGEYCILHFLAIPAERVNACVLVFRFSLIATFIAMFSVPYVAMFTARQKIAETAFWGTLQALLAFFLAFSLSYANADRLLVYTMGMVGITVVITLCQVIRATIIFPECQIVRKFWFSREHTQELLVYASWSFIGCFGGILRNQGTAILLNLFHGPKVNAAYGIANQVATQTGIFAQAMLGAMSPEITAIAGRGDRQRMLDLTVRASKFGTLLALLFTIPLFVEMEYILNLWLKTPPAYTAIFCQLILLSFLLDKITIGHMMAVNAQGRIATYQLFVGGILLCTLPLGYLLLKLFTVPVAALVAFIMTSIGCAIGRVYWGYHLLALSPRRWFTGVLGRCLLIAIPATALSAVPHIFLPASLPRLGLSIVLSLASTVTLGWLIGITPAERNYLTHSIHDVLIKIGRSGG
jgi:O-antigen/teichoic acid export membrane protein